MFGSLSVMVYQYGQYTESYYKYRQRTEKYTQHRRQQRREKYMQVIRYYATPDKAVNVQKLITQLIQLELEKVVNTTNVNSLASHEKMTLEGDCA